MKRILDACCGGKMFYFDKHDKSVLFQDIRKIDTTLCDGRKFSVDPDVLADFKSMPYPDGTFRPYASKVSNPAENRHHPTRANGEIRMVARTRVERCSETWLCRMLPCIARWRLSYIQVERDRHQGVGNTRPHTLQARLRSYQRKAFKHSLDMLYQR